MCELSANSKGSAMQDTNILNSLTNKSTCQVLFTIRVLRSVTAKTVFVFQNFIILHNHDITDYAEASSDPPTALTVTTNIAPL